MIEQQVKARQAAAQQGAPAAAIQTTQGNIQQDMQRQQWERTNTWLGTGNVDSLSLALSR